MILEKLIYTLSEYIFSIIIVSMCFLIYNRTKQIYDLTKHKGIKYFRNAFLSFSLAYLTRLILSTIKLNKSIFNIKFRMHLVMPYALLLTSYLSTIAIFYLSLSLFSRKVKKSFEVFLHIIAIIISFYVFLTHSILLLGFIQIILLIIIIIAYYAKTSKTSNISIIYTLLLIFWIFNIFILEPKIFLPIPIKIFFYVLSTIIFIIIYQKVRKWTK